MDKHVHIVTHDVPWPVSHGGYVDLFHKIETLFHAGIKVHLHSFSYGRPVPDELKNICYSIHVYQRKTGFTSIHFSYPYIVQSRNDKKLLDTLLQDEYPIIFEGIHTTYWLAQDAFKGRKVIVRLHNIEHKYYAQLARHENNIFKKIYYKIESLLLKSYEKKIATKALIAAVSSIDAEIYRDEFNADAHFLPVFLPWQKVSSPSGNGCFCLYHGNLAVSENEKVAEWLLNEVFNDMDIPLVIAGKDPSLPLKTLAHQQPHTCIVINPSEKEMQDMLSKAHINIIPSFNSTGVKLKLLNSLFNGRHCVANDAAMEGAETPSCHMAESKEDFKKVISRLFHIPFSKEEIADREKKLHAVYNNEKNIQQLIAWIY